MKGILMYCSENWAMTRRSMDRLRMTDIDFSRLAMRTPRVMQVTKEKILLRAEVARSQVCRSDGEVGSWSSQLEAGISGYGAT